jgi:hypothetical protein
MLLSLSSPQKKDHAITGNKRRDRI